MHLTKPHLNRAPRRPPAEVRPFLPVRRAYLDVLAEGRRKHLIHGLIEIDVTKARRALRSRAATGQPLSFTALVMHAVDSDGRYARSYADKKVRWRSSG